MLKPLVADRELAGCASQDALVRMDGQEMRGNAQLQTRASADAMACQGERSKAHMAGYSGGGLAQAIDRAMMGDQVFKGCMADRGYVVVPADKASEAVAHFQAVASQPASNVKTSSVAP